MKLSLFKKNNAEALFRWVDQTLEQNGSSETPSLDIKIEAALVNMKKNNSNNWFSVTDVGRVYDLFNAKMSSETSRLLDALHCVEWGDMSPELRATVNALILKDLKPYLTSHEVKAVEIAE